MPNLVLVPNSKGSKSARLLADLLTQKLRHKVFRVAANRVNGRIPFVYSQALDKLQQFRRFADANVSCPEFTDSLATARNWAANGDVVVCRTLLRSSEGKGIVIAENRDQVVAAPLFTKYVKKKKEFRVHVLNGTVIDVQEKRKRRGGEDNGNVRIRNLANGYVFCRDGVVEPHNLRELALQAVRAVGYSLGAVDIVFNERSNTCYVLEVNACPGMQGTTLEVYANALANWYKEQNNAVRR